MDKARFGGGPAGRSDAVDTFAAEAVPGEASAVGETDAVSAAKVGERAIGLLTAMSASASAAIVNARLGGGPAGRSDNVDIFSAEAAPDDEAATGEDCAEAAAIVGEACGANAAMDDGERASLDGGNARSAGGSTGAAGDSGAISNICTISSWCTWTGAGVSDAGLGIRLPKSVAHTMTAKFRMPIANVHSAIIVSELTKSEHTLLLT